MLNCFYVHTVEKALASPRNCADSTKPSLLDNDRNYLIIYLYLNMLKRTAHLEINASNMIIAQV